MNIIHKKVLRNVVILFAIVMPITSFLFLHDTTVKTSLAIFLSFLVSTMLSVFVIMFSNDGYKHEFYHKKLNEWGYTSSLISKAMRKSPNYYNFDEIPSFSEVCKEVEKHFNNCYDVPKDEAIVIHLKRLCILKVLNNLRGYSIILDEESNNYIKLYDEEYLFMQIWDK